MKATNGFLNGLLITVGAACLISAASCTRSPQPDLGVTAGRAAALVAVVVGLISAVIGGLALARAAGLTGTGGGRAGAIAALALGLLGLVLSIVHLGRSTGGFGTGGGRAGAFVALVLALIGASLGGLALSRSRRTD